MERTFAIIKPDAVASRKAGQILARIEAAGFTVDPKRAVTETVSGSTAAMQRPGFAKLVDRLEAGDVLVVTKLDRLGRNAMDVRATVERLAGEGVRVHCLALGGIDLTSPAGKMTMGVICAVAEFERDLLIERTQSGLSRAKAEGIYDTTLRVFAIASAEKVTTAVAADRLAEQRIAAVRALKPMARPNP